MDDQGTEMVSFQLVAAAGEARSLAFEALEKAKAGDFDAAAKLMKQSKDAGIKAHHIQTQLLSTEAAGEHLSVDVLLVHAQATSCAPCLLRSSCLYERTAAKNA